MKKIVAVLAVLACATMGYSQITFSADSTKFFEESQGFLGSVNKADARKFMKEFELVWYGGKLSQKQRTRVYATANEMMAKKLKAYPDYKAYLNSLANFFKKEQPEGSFESWHNTIEKMASVRDKRKFSQYLKTCSDLFSEGVIYRSSSTIWKAEAAEFKFDYKKVPIVTFKETKITCLAKGDSGMIYKTKGTFLPLSNIWEGEGGMVTWERAALPKEETYANLKKYRIRLKSSSYDADSVEFITPYFKHPIIGKLSENVLSNNRGPQYVSYPRFESYDKRLEIKEIFKDMDYNGGFTMKGQNLIGKGTPDELARIDIRYEQKPFMTAKALVFTINETSIASDESSINFKLDKDSVYHPGLRFKYVDKSDTESKKLTLIRGGNGLGKSPYFNSFHGLDMVFEALYWKIGDSYMEFGPLFGSSENTAFFESSKYFTKARYDRLTGMGTNPLVIIKNFVKKKKTKTFSKTELATFMGKSVNEEGFESFLMNLNNMGFIVYDRERESIQVEKRLYHYLGARSGRSDYDVLQFVSEEGSLEKKNATLSLLNYDLQLNGVKSVTLSKAQGTKVFPDDGKLVIKKNRSFTFGGVVLAGRTEHYGSEYSFDYEKFRINLIENEWSRFFVKTAKGSEDPFTRLQSQIVGVRGYIDIDHPKNKSGRDTTKHEYPKLVCSKKTHVYYDHKKIHGGAYKKEDFYFEVEPFEMDSLDNFTNEGLALDGTFVSSGIFPRFKEKLRVQEDYSFGFKRKAPEEGYGIYGEKAKYTNDIRLSNQGLQGSGDIDYLSSHAESSAITFLPDSLSAIAEIYENKGGKGPPETPNVTATNVKVVYVPDNKLLHASTINRKDSLNFYDGEGLMLGRLTLRPERMNGNGLMTVNKKGELLAVNFKFKERRLDADTADFNLLSYDLGSMAFTTTNVTAYVDFDERVGEFKSNGGQSYVTFPENQYICYMDKFKWLMEDDNLEMEAAKRNENNIKIDSDLDLAGPNFYSVHPKQDSLSFRAPKAVFDNRKKLVTCRELEYITVADARITPDSGIIYIEKKAKIRTLKNSSIVTNYISKYHNIKNATTDIKAKNDYRSSGYYIYKDENDREQEIFFAKIAPDTTWQSYAEGEIKESAEFKLSPHFDYFGKVEMFASQKELLFTGSTRISHKCTGITKNWMNFIGAIDAQEVFIPVSADMKDDKGNKVGAGIVMNQDSISLYPTFLSTKKKDQHLDIISADGFLYFNTREYAYQISNREKLKERTLPGNFVSLDVNECGMIAEGKWDFGTDLGQFTATPYGEVIYSPEKHLINASTSIIMNFPFNENALEKMAKDINDYPDLAPVDFQQSTYEKTLREILGLEKSDKVISDLNIHGQVKRFPDELISSLVLSQVKLVWNKKTNSYRSVGKIGIGNILKKQVYKQVDGHVEIIKRQSGDIINVYLQVDENNYYFFNYKKGFLSVYSTNEAFNTTISETKTDKTKFKGSKEVADFQYLLSSKTKVTAFLRSLED